jgi:DNA-binding GntR family transcriptional regulator
MTADPQPFDLTMVGDVFSRWADLHAAATLLGTPRLTPGHFDRLRAADADYVAALADGRIDDAIAADDAFHRVLLDAADDPDLEVSVDLLIPRMRRMDLWIFTRKLFTPPAESASSHPAIVAALERGDAEEASELVRRNHLDAADELEATLAAHGAVAR